MPFGQVVIGPPGSGKTTYCAAAAALLRAAGRRVAVVNLDPANDRRRPTSTAGSSGGRSNSGPASASGCCELDVMDLVCLESVMRELGLGPNGGLLYCVDHLAANLDWLERRLAALVHPSSAGASSAAAGGADSGGGGGDGAPSGGVGVGGCDYFLFDCPGQLELFTLSDSFKRVLDALTGSGPEGRRAAAEAAKAAASAGADEPRGGGGVGGGGAGAGAGGEEGTRSGGPPRPTKPPPAPVLGTFRLTAVQLLDAHLCADPAKYVAALVTALSAALRLELPHVAALSKADLLQRVASGGALDFRLDFYTEVQDLPRLARRMDDEAEVEEAALRGAAAEAAEQEEARRRGGGGGEGGGRTEAGAAATDAAPAGRPPAPARRAFSERYRKLTAGLCEVVQDFGLLSFTPLSVRDPASLRRVLHLADKASGALFAPIALAAEAAAAAAASGAGPREASRLAARAAEGLGSHEGGPAAGDGAGDGGDDGEGDDEEQPRRQLERRRELAAVAAAVAASGAPAEFLYGAAASGALPMAPDADAPSEDYHERYVNGAWRTEVEAARKRAAEEAAGEAAAAGAAGAPPPPRGRGGD